MRLLPRSRARLVTSAAVAALLSPLLVPTGPAGAAANSRPGEGIYLSENGAVSVAADGSGSLALAADATARVPSLAVFSPDGDRLAYKNDLGIAVAALDGTEERQITRRASGPLIDRLPAWWDARTVVYTQSDPAAQRTQIVLVPADGNGPERPVFAQPLQGYVTGAVAVDSRTGDLVFGRGDGYWIARHQGNGGFASPELLFPGRSTGRVVASPDGTRLAFIRDVQGIDQLMVANIDGSGLRQLTGGCGSVVDAAWSPQSDRLAVASGYGVQRVDVRDLSGTMTAYVPGPRRLSTLLWRPQQAPAPSPAPTPLPTLTAMTTDTPRVAGDNGTCDVAVVKSATDNTLWYRQQAPGDPAAVRWMRFSEPVLDYAVSFGRDGSVAVAARRASDKSLWFVSAFGYLLDRTEWSRIGGPAADVHLTTRHWGTTDGLMLVARDIRTTEVYANELKANSSAWDGWYRLGGPASEVAVPTDWRGTDAPYDTPIVARTPSGDGVYLRDVGPVDPRDWTRLGDAAAKIRVDVLPLRDDGWTTWLNTTVVTAKSPHDGAIYGVTSVPGGTWQRLGEPATDWTTQVVAAPPATLHILARNPANSKTYETKISNGLLPPTPWWEFSWPSPSLPALNVLNTYPARTYTSYLPTSNNSLTQRTCIQNQCTYLPLIP